MLNLTLTSLSPLSTSRPETKSFAKPEIVVGRETGLDWSLVDPDKKLSRRHFVIRLQNGQYWLEHKSINGVTLNDSIDLEAGRPVRLTSGDKLRLCHYQFVVRFDEPVVEKIVDATDPFPLIEPHTGFDIVVDPAVNPPVGGGTLADIFDLDGPSWQDGEPDLPAAPKPGPSQRSAESDHVPATREFFQLPDVRPAPPSGDLTFDQGPALAVRTAPAAAASESDDPFAFLNEIISMPMPAPVKPPAPPPAPPPPAPTPPRPKPVPAPSPVPPPATDAAAAALGAFLKGAGLDPATLRETDGPAVLARAGAILRESIHGLITILNARNMIKNDLRMERTMLQPLDNIRGRDACYQAPPARIRARGIPAHGSYLGYLTA